MIVKQASRLDHVQEYYFSHKLREVAKMNAEGKNIINLGIGKPDLSPPPLAIKSLNEAAREATSHGYQSYSGIPELRSAFSQWYLDSYKVELDPDSEILPLIGSKEGIMHITMSFLEQGDQVLVPNPGYPAYASAARLSGATCVFYDLKEENDWLPSIQDLKDKELSKVKLMWINYPNMPTGAQANPLAIKELVTFCSQNNILLCHDNPYSFILNQEPFSIFNVDGAKECSIELNSLSKSHNMSGWRVGMLGASSDYIKTILKFKSNMDSGMFRAVQEGAATALKMGPSWYKELNKVYQERRLIVVKLITLLDCTFRDNQSGMFLWAKINDRYRDAKELADEILYNANVFITPGSIFGSNGDRYIRISLCQPKELISEAVHRVETFKKGA